ncbi:MAG: hypothetical protein GX142_05375 [Chloroflexi bacterium]|jgi:protein-tyrosine-phosphatase|nr:hypothetical protein [Chloroflexota bacterium]
MLSILFICTANRFRSPIAAIYFARSVVRNGDDSHISVSSAGTWTTYGQPVTPEALTQAERYSLNLSLHKSRPITKEILAQADLILVMENNQKEALHQEFPIFADRICLLTEVVNGKPDDVPDPYVTEEDPAIIAAEIIALIDHGYERIVQFALRSKNKNKPDAQY